MNATRLLPAMFARRFYRWWTRPTRAESFPLEQIAESDRNTIEEANDLIEPESESISEMGEGEQRDGEAITGFDWSDRAIRAAMEETEIEQLSNPSTQLAGDLFQAASDFRNRLLELTGNAETLPTQDNDTVVVTSSSPSTSQAKKSSPRKAQARKPSSRKSSPTSSKHVSPNRKLPSPSRKQSRSPSYPDRSPSGVSKTPEARARSTNPRKRSHSANAAFTNAVLDSLVAGTPPPWMDPARDFTWQASKVRNDAPSGRARASSSKPSKSVVEPSSLFSTAGHTPASRRASSVDPSKVRFGPFEVLRLKPSPFTDAIEEGEESLAEVEPVKPRGNKGASLFYQESPPSRGGVDTGSVDTGSVDTVSVSSYDSLEPPWIHSYERALIDANEIDPLTRIQHKRLSTSKRASKAKKPKTPTTLKKPAAARKSATPKARTTKVPTTPKRSITPSKSRVAKPKASATPKKPATTPKSGTAKAKAPATPKRATPTSKRGTAKSTPKSTPKGAEADAEPVTPVVTRLGRVVKTPKHLADEQASLPQRRGSRQTTTTRSSPAKKAKTPGPKPNPKAKSKAKGIAQAEAEDTIYVHVSDSEHEDEAEPLEEHDEDVIEGQRKKKRKRTKEEDRIWSSRKNGKDEIEEEEGDTIVVKKRAKRAQKETKWKPVDVEEETDEEEGY
ncbi:antigen identified by monoclonal antibody Ki-67 [Thelotrema lepadinum]|nr:antigen identified by monoclonal antibody Ki-67 [Thelotrema lepadinum]